MPDLSPAQAAAVRHPLWSADARLHALVSACPGSGKTRTLIARILHLLREGVEPSGILACSFTVAASNELAARLTAESPEAGGVLATTLHAWALGFLRQHGGTDGRYPDASRLVVRTDDELAGIVREARQALAYFDRDVTIAAVLKLYHTGCVPNDAKRAIAANRVVERLIRMLEAENSITYDRIVPQAVEFLSAKPEAYRYVLVDEGQDLSHDQWELVELFSALGAQIFVVGDADQGIYRWRGASPESFLTFSRRPDCQVYRLGENYRSGPEICDRASRLIAHNQDRIAAGPITPIRNALTPVLLHQHENAEEEAEAVRMSIQEWLSENLACSPADVAVLAPTHARLDVVEDALRAAGIPCCRNARQEIGGEAGHYLDLLRLIVHPDDDYLVRRCVNWPTERIDPVELSRQAARAKGANQSLLRQLQESDNQEARLWAERLKTLLSHDHAVDSLMDDGMASTALDLSLAIVAWGKSTTAAGKPATIAAFVHDLEAGDFRLGAADVGRAVTLSTIHGAKGLEWRLVCVLGHEEGTMPKALDKEAEEQRRLCFVAWTRAADALHLLWIRNAPNWGGIGTHPTRPSRFLREAGLLKEGDGE